MTEPPCDDSRSSFLRALGHPWQNLERDWNKVTKASKIGDIVRNPSQDGLRVIWEKFERGVVKAEKKPLTQIFDELLTQAVAGHQTRFVLAKESVDTAENDAEWRDEGHDGDDDGDEVYLEEEASGSDDDNDSDGPPELTSPQSEDEVKAAPKTKAQAIVPDEYDSDEPPPLYEVSTDDEPVLFTKKAVAPESSDSDSDAGSETDSDDVDYSADRPLPQGARRVNVPAAAAPPPRRRRVPRRPPTDTPTQQAPVRAARGVRPVHDTSRVRPDWEFGTRDGIRGEEVDEQVTARLKVKTRAERDEARAAREAEGVYASTTEEDTEEEGSPLAGHTFKVTKRVYATFEQYLGVGVNRYAYCAHIRLGVS